jgi:hypothetical protein
VVTEGIKKIDALKVFIAQAGSLNSQGPYPGLLMPEGAFLGMVLWMANLLSLHCHFNKCPGRKIQF